MLEKKIEPELARLAVGIFGSNKKHGADLNDKATVDVSCAPRFSEGRTEVADKITGFEILFSLYFYVLERFSSTYLNKEDFIGYFN